MIVWRIKAFKSVPSTQDIVSLAAKQGEREGFVVIAKEQTAGRGRHGRIWEGGTGNLTASFLIKPNCGPDGLGQISLLIGLSITQTFAPMGISSLLKWPNDILIGGKKVCGILIEAEDGNLIIGLGLNIKSAPLSNTTYLAEHSPNAPDSEEILQRILNQFAMNYKKWIKDGFHAIREEWMQASFELDTPIHIKAPLQTLSGAYAGIDDLGNLKLRLDDGTMKIITAGEVFLPFEQKE